MVAIEGEEVRETRGKWPAALRLRAEKGCWRLGVTLTCGPQLAVTARKRKGGEGAGPRVWWAARAGAGPKEEEVGRRRIAGRWAEKGVG
jgi:hypothetical protein